MYQEPQADIPQSSVLQVNRKATTSLVLGIIGLIAFLIPLIGLPITVIGLIVGIKGLNSAKKKRAIVGVVLCIIGLILTIVNASIGAYLGATGQHPIVNEILKLNETVKPQ